MFNHIHRKIRPIAVLVATALLALGLVAAPAQAAPVNPASVSVPMGNGTCVPKTNICARGSIGLQASSDSSICTYRNWSGGVGLGPCYRIYPGQRTPASVDTDGFKSHPTCKTYLVAGPVSNLLAKNAWQKVNDAQRATLRVVC